MIPTFATIVYSPVWSFSPRLGPFSLKNWDWTVTQSGPNFFGDCRQSGLEKIDWTALRSSPNFFGDCTTVQSQNSRPDCTKISSVQSGPGPTVQSGQSNNYWPPTAWAWILPLDSSYFQLFPGASEASICLTNPCFEINNLKSMIWNPCLLIITNTY